MANSYTVYSATAGQQTFAVPFPFLRQQDVTVYINGVEQLTPKDYVWLTGGSIQLNGSLIHDANVRIQRSTSPNTALVSFTNGAMLTASQLNLGFLQNFYLNEESIDALNDYISNGLAQFTVSGQIEGLTPEELIQQAAMAVLQTELANDLLSATTDISNNAESILQNTLDITNIQGLIDDLTAGSGSAANLVATEAAARVDGDTALQSQLNLIGSVSGDSEAFIVNQSTLKVDPDTSFADFVTGIASQITTATDSVLSVVSSTYATQASLADYSTSAEVTTEIGSSVDALSATISATYATQATLNGITSSEFTLKTDVNGHIAGFGLMNTGTASQFIVNANTFSIIDTSNGMSSPIVPFTVTGGTVFMNSVVIKDAVIQTLTISKLTQGALNADMDIGTGRLVFKNSSAMMIEGANFGVSPGLVQWYGPVNGTTFNGTTGVPNFTALKPSNAISCLTTDGWTYNDRQEGANKSGTGPGFPTGETALFFSAGGTVSTSWVVPGFAATTFGINTGTTSGLPPNATATGFYRFALDRFNSKANTFTQLVTIDTAGFTVSGAVVNSAPTFIGYVWSVPSITGFTSNHTDTPPGAGNYAYRIRFLGVFISGTIPTGWTSPIIAAGNLGSTVGSYTLTASEPQNYSY